MADDAMPQAGPAPSLVPSPPLRGLLHAVARWRAEWVVVLVLPLLVATALWSAHEASLLRPVRDWLQVNAGTDSWYPMGRAIELLREPGVRVYQELFFGEHVKFQYPPTSLVLHEAAQRLGRPLQADDLNLLNWWLVWVHAALCGWFGWRLAVRSPARRGAMPAWHAAALAACVGLLCYPVLKAYALGQVQLWIDVAFLGACLAWLAGRKAVAGALVGAICLLKPQFSLFLLWGALRLEWRFLAGWAVVVALGLAASLAFFGLQNHLDYLQVLSALSATGEAYSPNQSVNGILNRLLGTAPATLWVEDGFPPADPLVRAGTLAATVLLVGGALLVRRRRPAGLLDVQLAALAFTMASPIAWEHHYGILPPLVIALYAATARLADAGRARLRYAVLGGCYLLAFGHLGVAHHADAGPGTLAQAYLFAAAAGILWLLLDAAKRTGGATTPEHA